LRFLAFIRKAKKIILKIQLILSNLEEKNSGGFYFLHFLFAAGR
jgi:hypothetical protein